MVNSGKPVWMRKALSSIKLAPSEAASSMTRDRMIGIGKTGDSNSITERFLLLKLTKRVLTLQCLIESAVFSSRQPTASKSTATRRESAPRIHRDLELHTKRRDPSLLG